MQPIAKEIEVLVQLYREGNFTRLESRARKLSKRNPGLPMISMLHAAALGGLGKRKQAIDILKKLVADQPTLVDAQFNLGQMLMEEDRMEEAAAAYRNAVRLKPDPEGFNNLGAVLREIEQIEESIAAFNQACVLKPDFHQAHFNHGLALHSVGKIEAAAKSFSSAVELSPKHAPSHYQLAICQREQGNVKSAEASFRRAVELDSEHEEAWLALGSLCLADGRIEEALEIFGNVEGEMGAVRKLEALLKTGDAERFRTTLAEAAEKWPRHRWMAAVCSFGCHQLQLDNPHPFAPDPISHVAIRDLRKDIDDMEIFTNELMEAADQMTAVWENRTTRGGFQTFGNLFGGTKIPEPLKQLEGCIREQIKNYLAERSDSDDLFVKHFPKKYGLFGWRVKLMSAGHQIAHIHAKGWLSGVFYLKIPQNIRDREGSIFFSLHGFDYPVTNPEIPEISHLPKSGDLVFFPSSLFHGTVPFESEEERQCIAFDVVPIE